MRPNKVFLRKALSNLFSEKRIKFLLTSVIIFTLTGLSSLILGLGTVKAAPPTDFQTTPVVTTGLDSPTGLQFSPDGRLFILERAGKVKIYKNGQVLANPFVDLKSVASGDRGLIGIAFDPDYATNHYVYFYYTAASDNHNRIIRFDASQDVAQDAGTVIYITNYNSDGLHVGGGLTFGPDGKIYLGVGDNGYPPGAQDYSTQQGKILRINKDGSIPNDNPFVGQAGKLPEIWAAGLRNPWRLTFDKVTGKLIVGDVGGGSWEEIDVITKGQNYGWPTCEGACSNPSFVNPFYAYDHSAGGAAITMGFRYTGNSFPAAYKSKLFFGDYVRGFIKTANLDQNGNLIDVTDFDTAAGSVVGMDQASDGSMYYVTYYPGRVYKVSYNPANQIPVANASADITKGLSPLTVNFSSQGSFDPDGTSLTYNWDFGDGTTSTDANPSKIYTKDGTYTAQLKVSDGVNTAQALPIIIQVGTPPTVTIFAPKDGDTYHAGDTITCNVFGTDGTGTDVNDNNISTYIILHHNTHIHPFLGPITGKVCTFTIPTVGESDANTWYEIKTTITDTIGLSTTKSVFIYPIKTNFTLNTVPQGLQITLEGSPYTAPTTIQGVVGYVRDMNVVSPQFLNGKSYQFDHWSDGGAQHHTLATSSDVDSYTAYFTEVPGFTGQYFNNKILSGTPVLTRTDANINFDWGNGSPDPSVNSDNFSARWIKTQNYDAGNYKLTVTADDGFRVYLDGNLVLDKWVDQPATTYNVNFDIPAGSHELKMEYYENGGQAVAKLDLTRVGDITPPPAPGTYFAAQYFNNKTLSGTSVLSRNESQINYDWGGGSPDPSVNSDNFSARWIKTDTLTDGQYQFTVTADDGFRLFIDGVNVLDKWVDQAATTYNITKNLTAGNHEIKLEYYENGGNAVAKLSYLRIGDLPTPTPTVTPTITPSVTPSITPSITPTPTIGTYTAKYWNTVGNYSMPQIPTTNPVLTRNDTDINFDWGGNSPDSSVRNDGFIAQWVGQFNFEDGDYKFNTTSDDGIRVFVDDHSVIDQWNDHAATQYSATKTMIVGAHTIRVEYYENGGQAVAKFNFSKINSAGSFKGEYFNNKNLSGTPIFTRLDDSINFNWHGGSPDPSLPSDNFSVRWTKTQSFSGSDTTFTVTADDGFRLYIDGVNVLDKWIDQPATTYTVTKNLTAGNHEIKLEYYENGGEAVAILNY